MSRKSFFFILVLSLAATSVPAQKAPEDRKRVEGSAFSFTFGGEGFLGVYTEEVSKENFAKFGLREVRGVAVTKVEENSPAAKAGILPNDVIVRIDGDEVTSVRKLNRLIGEVAPDHTTRITVLRNGSEVDLSAVIERRKFEKFDGNFTFPRVEMPKIELPDMPEVPQALMIPDSLGWKTPGEFQTMYFASSRQIGISVSSLSKQLGDYFGVPEGKGLLVTSVRENGPAFKAGIKAGDVIIEAEGKPVVANGDLVRAIGGKKDGDLRLTIVRDKNRQTISVTPEDIKGLIAPESDGQRPAYLLTTPKPSRID